MSKATYATMPALIAARIPFTHGSCHAFFDAEGHYQIVSYRTRIATYYKDAGERQRLFEAGWVLSPNCASLDERKYSVTTSRLQNIIRKAWKI